MGYHDLNPISFLVSEAVRDTNTAEEAALYERWLIDCKKKLASSQENEFSEETKVSTMKGF